MSNERHNRTMLGISPFRLDEEEAPAAAEAVKLTGERLAVAPVSLTDDDGWDVPDLADVVARGPTPLSTTAVDANDAPKLPTLGEVAHRDDADDRDSERVVPHLGGNDGAVTGAVPRLSSLHATDNEVGASTMMMSASALAGMLGDDAPVRPAATAARPLPRPASVQDIPPERVSAPVATAVAAPDAAPAVGTAGPVAPPVAEGGDEVADRADDVPHTAPLAPPGAAADDAWEVARRGGTVRLSAVDFHKLVVTGEQPPPMSTDELAGSKHALGGDDLTDSRVALPGPVAYTHAPAAPVPVPAALEPGVLSAAAPLTPPPPIQASVAAMVNDRRANEQRPVATTAPVAVAAPSPATKATASSSSTILIVGLLFAVLAAAGVAAYFILSRG